MSKPPAGLPSKLSICGTEWTVEYVENMLADGKGFGFCDSSVRRIRIALDQHPDVMRCTLLHEALHAALALNGASQFKGKDQHAIIDALEVPLLSLIRDNKVKW